MGINTKIKKEIERLEKLIEDSETILEQVPNHLRPSQEIALQLHRDCITKLETMLANSFTRVKG